MRVKLKSPNHVEFEIRHNNGNDYKYFMCNNKIMCPEEMYDLLGTEVEVVGGMGISEHLCHFWAEGPWSWPIQVIEHITDYTNFDVILRENPAFKTFIWHKEIEEIAQGEANV